MKRIANRISCLISLIILLAGCFQKDSSARSIYYNIKGHKKEFLERNLGIIKKSDFLKMLLRKYGGGCDIPEGKLKFIDYDITPITQEVTNIEIEYREKNEKGAEILSVNYKDLHSDVIKLKLFRQNNEIKGQEEM